MKILTLLIFQQLEFFRHYQMQLMTKKKKKHFKRIFITPIFRWFNQSKITQFTDQKSPDLQKFGTKNWSYLMRLKFRMKTWKIQGYNYLEFLFWHKGKTWTSIISPKLKRIHFFHWTHKKGKSRSWNQENPVSSAYEVKEEPSKLKKENKEREFLWQIESP